MSNHNAHFDSLVLGVNHHASWSLRDPTGDVYLQYANGSSPTGMITYDSEHDAAKVTLPAGGGSLSLQDMLRLDFPELKKGVDQEVSFQWEARWSQEFVSILEGGVNTHKAFRLDHQANRPHETGRRFELQTRYYPPETSWVALPTIRSYHNGPHGGDGEASPLSSNNREDFQPGGQSELFHINPEVWTRFTLSVTWHDDEQRIRLWIADEDRDPVLVIADPDDPDKGFLADMAEGDPAGLDQFLVLFNTSQSATGDLIPKVWVRNVVVYKDETIALGGRPIGLDGGDDPGDGGDDPDPDPGDDEGDGEDPDPDPGDDEGDGEDPDPDPGDDEGDGADPDPDPGDDEGDGADPDPDPGDDEGDGADPDPDPGDDEGDGEDPDPVVEIRSLEDEYPWNDELTFGDIYDEDFQIDSVEVDEAGEHIVKTIKLSGTVNNITGVGNGFSSREEISIISLNYFPPAEFTDDNGEAAGVAWTELNALDYFESYKVKEGPISVFNLTTDVFPVLAESDDKTATFGINWKGNQDQGEGFVQYVLDFSDVTFIEISADPDPDPGDVFKIRPAMYQVNLGDDPTRQLVFTDKFGIPHTYSNGDIFTSCESLDAYISGPNQLLKKLHDSTENELVSIEIPANKTVAVEVGKKKYRLHNYSEYDVEVVAPQATFTIPPMGKTLFMMSGDFKLRHNQSEAISVSAHIMCR